MKFYFDVNNIQARAGTNGVFRIRNDLMYSDIYVEILMRCDTIVQPHGHVVPVVTNRPKPRKRHTTRKRR